MWQQKRNVGNKLGFWEVKEVTRTKKKCYLTSTYRGDGRYLAKIPTQNSHHFQIIWPTLENCMICTIFKLFSENIITCIF